ncbi:MAG: glycosyltransferase [Meiothermus sp.]|nr:glycosyltransferase [Meiothermus sp.]
MFALVWLHPRMWSLLEMGTTPVAKAALGYFVVFTYVAWLFALYNLGIVLFAIIYRKWFRTPFIQDVGMLTSSPAVAILYTTCNDFVEESVMSCVLQNYPNFKVYILDDSTNPEYQRRIDRFAARHVAQVRVVRRPDRRGFKAGNLNHGLSKVAHEPLFVLADADEILPSDFLSRLVPRLLADERCGFIQANHHSNPQDSGGLARAMGIGVDIHWRWYQPLRNCFGFVMLLGHGALIRRQSWEESDGFPELVSEDLAFSIALRHKGWHGRFAEDVICYESFPEDMRAFRIRHMKWTRGSCEFLHHRLGFLLQSSNISLVEKVDILLPVLGLPLSLFFFLYLLDANILLVAWLGHLVPLSLLGGLEVEIRSLAPVFHRISSPDFLIMTLLAVLAPVLCFVLELGRKPHRLYRFLSASVVVNGALAPLATLGIVLYLFTRKAVFHVTGERGEGLSRAPSWQRSWQQFLKGSHPDHWGVRFFEMGCAVLLMTAGFHMLNFPLLGIALAFMLQPILHQAQWHETIIQRLIHLPVILVLSGLAVNVFAFLLS